MHHAYAIEAGGEEGVAQARAWVERELGMRGSDNPDIVVLTYGLLSVEDARRVAEIAALGPVGKATTAKGGSPDASRSEASRVVIIAAARAYREAQNALLKLFEEPPPGTYLFLILPALGGLLPTLRSRLHVLRSGTRESTMIYHSGERAREFIESGRAGRSALIKRLTSGTDEEERRARRDEALALINGIETAAYTARIPDVGYPISHIELLEELQVLRGYVHQPSAPLKMILEHLAIVTPQSFSGQAPRNLV